MSNICLYRPALNAEDAHGKSVLPCRLCARHINRSQAHLLRACFHISYIVRRYKQSARSFGAFARPTGTTARRTGTIERRSGTSARRLDTSARRSGTLERGLSTSARRLGTSERASGHIARRSGTFERSFVNVFQSSSLIKKRKGNSLKSPFLLFSSSQCLSYCPGTGGCAPGGTTQTSTVVRGRLPHLVMTIFLGSTPRDLTK